MFKPHCKWIDTAQLMLIFNKYNKYIILMLNYFKFVNCKEKINNLRSLLIRCPIKSRNQAHLDSSDSVSSKELQVK